MSEYLNANGKLIALSDIKRIGEVTPEERESLAKLGPRVQADRFFTRIEYAKGGKSYATESIRDFVDQNVNLVQVEEGAFVPRSNIKFVSEFTEDDRIRMENRNGREVRADFKSGVNTTAGRVLSTLEPKVIMQRMGRPYNPDLSEGADQPQQKARPVQRPQAANQDKPAPTQDEIEQGVRFDEVPTENQQSMAVRRDDVMAQVSSDSKTKAPQPSRSPEQ